MRQNSGFDSDRGDLSVVFDVWLGLSSGRILVPRKRSILLFEIASRQYLTQFKNIVTSLSSSILTPLKEETTQKTFDQQKNQMQNEIKSEKFIVIIS